MRLAVTDRCNLRCTYCMPENGMIFQPRKELLTYEEMMRLIGISAGLGINKVRITGGEPFVRKDLIYFLKNLTAVEGLEKIAITTNGILIQDHLDVLTEIGVKDINLSLDTVNAENFKRITRRDRLKETLVVLNDMVNIGMRVKINTVVMPGKNTSELHEIAELASKYPVDVRFIEEMPFNGTETVLDQTTPSWNFKEIQKTLLSHYPKMKPVKSGFSSTSRNFEIPGFKGLVGIIPAFTRTICGGCNRIRVTATGRLKLCLYDNAGIDLKGILRNSQDDNAIASFLKAAIQKKPKDGFAAEKEVEKFGEQRESMSTIGG